jgi:hypothetical protein
MVARIVRDEVQPADRHSRKQCQAQLQQRRLHENSADAGRREARKIEEKDGSPENDRPPMQLSQFFSREAHPCHRQKGFHLDGPHFQ